HYFEKLIRSRTAVLHGYGWGVTHLRLNHELLGLGRIAIEAAHGVLPDGTATVRSVKLNMSLLLSVIKLKARPLHCGLGQQIERASGRRQSCWSTVVLLRLAISGLTQSTCAQWIVRIGNSQ
ncbi:MULTISPECIES: type VI secretion system baseplate subunit TssK, partial [unclassified Rhizobium]|uniref:type VI secretion system baseplate subunit TssK n=1 Tax=unclassified Rhizobium TaxID=2613769 RepID=UPI002180A275